MNINPLINDFSFIFKTHQFLVQNVVIWDYKLISLEEENIYVYIFREFMREEKYLEN